MIGGEKGPVVGCGRDGMVTGMDGTDKNRVASMEVLGGLTFTV